MDNLITYALSVFMAFFAVMNPIANVPVFMGLTSDQSKANKKKIIKTACITAFLIVVAFILVGKDLFDVFGITIPAFKITGGILIFYVGFEMLISKKSKVHRLNNNTNTNPDINIYPDQEDANNIAVSPLAIPILAGPGTIVTAMNYVTNGTLIHVSIVIAIFAFMILLTYLAFSLSDVIVNKLGRNLIKVLNKLMGLILAIIGTGMIIAGIKIAFSLT